MTRGLLPVLAAALLLPAGVGADENILSDLARANFVPAPAAAPGAPAPGAAAVTRTAAGTLLFTCRGAAGARARWEARLPGAVPAAGQVEVAARTVNVVARPDQPNVYLELEKRDPAVAGQRQTVPLFAAVGREHSELRVTEFAAAGGTLLPRAIAVDLVIGEDGNASLELRALKITFAGNLLADAELERILARPPGVQAEVQAAARGSLTLTVNGRPVDAWGCAGLANAALAKTIAFTNGLRLNRVSAPLGGPDSLWSYPEYFDRDRLAAALQQACPGKDSLVILDVRLEQAPAWWPGAPSPPGRPGDADPAWRAYVQAALAQLLAAVRQGPYNRWVVGVTLNLGPRRNLAALPGREDSPAYVAGFRAWLTAGYDSDDALRTAWEQPLTRRATAVPAPRAQWPVGAVGPLFHPRAPRAGRDSYAFYCQSWTRYLTATADLVKRLSQGEYLCGVANGPALYLNELWNNQHQLSPDGLRLLLAAPAVDYVELDLDDTDRRLALGTTGNELLLADLLRAHHKLLVLRAPGRLEPPAPDGAAIALAPQLLRREFLNALAGPAALLFAPPDPESFARPWVQAEFQRAADIRARLGTRPPPPPPAVAFAVDPELFAAFGPEPARPIVGSAEVGAAANPRRLGTAASSAWHLLGVPRLHWPRAGVPFAVVSVDDLEPGPWRLVVLYHVLRLTPERQHRLAALRAGGRTVVWLWADTMLGDGVFSPRLTADLTGIGLQLQPRPGRLFLTAEPALGEFLGLTRLADYFGAPVGDLPAAAAGELTFTPRFVVAPTAGPATVLLARYADGGEPALAARATTDWTAVYSATPVLNPEILRALARRSGVHVYQEDNHQLYFLPGAIGLHARVTGPSRLRLPEPTALFEVFSGREFPAAREHPLELQAGTTYLFFRGDRAAWDALAPPPRE